MHKPPGQVFAESLNWTSAKARCEDDAPAGFNGALAAARSQTEQDFLINIAEEQSWGMKFWLAGSSVVDDQREGAWAWGPPYYLDVRFRSTNWTNDRMIVNTVPRGVKGEPEYLNGMALLNGHRGAYAWKISNTTEAHPFICWKQSCPDGKDVLNGLCRSDAYSIMNPAEEEEKVESWIAGVVVIAIFLAVLMVLLALWKFNTPWFVLIITSTTACCQNKKQQARLSKRLSTSSGFGGDTTSEFVPAFSGPDRIGPHRVASGIGGAFIPVEAPLPNPAGVSTPPPTLRTDVRTRALPCSSSQSRARRLIVSAGLCVCPPPPSFPPHSPMSRTPATRSLQQSIRSLKSRRRQRSALYQR